MVVTDFAEQRLATGEVALAMLDADGAAGVLDRFHAAVDATATANCGRDHYWYTWLSSRDRLHAPLHDQLVLLARIERTFADAPAGTYTMALDDGDVAAAAATVLRRSGVRVDVPATSRAVWRARRLWRAARRGATTARFAQHALRLQRIAAQRTPSAAADGLDVVIVTLFDGRAPANDGPHVDRYFGGLVDHLASRGERAVIAGSVIDDFDAWLRYLARPHGTPLVSTYHLTGPRDVARAWRQTLVTRRLAVPRDASVPVRLLSSSLRGDPLARMEGALLHVAFGRLLDRNPAARVIHMYENNAWERAVDLAARRRKRDVIGYLHCAISPAHPKFHVTDVEAPLRPAPDRIVCTGPAAREVLLRLGHHDPARVDAGCALRRPSSPRVDRRPRRRELRTVLALFEGLWTMVPFLRLLQQSLDELAADVVIEVRAHPVLSVEAIAERAGVRLGGRLVSCGTADLATAITAADVVA